MEQIQQQVVNNLSILIQWFLFSVALQRVLRKMGGEKTWMAYVPGLRYLALSERLDMARDGVVCAVLDALSVIAVLVNLTVAIDMSERVSLAMALIQLVVIVALFVFRIRFFLALIRAFGLRKRWIILWLVAEWLTLMIIGFGKKYQPVAAGRIHEDWEAGTAPAEIPGVRSPGGRAMSNTGLSVDLRERTVKELFEKRYLLKDIALNIPNGSLVLLLGGSGAGKTTFVNALIGYEKADATVLLNGADVYKDYDRMKYRIGFVPQQNLIRGNDTVQHTVTDAAELRLPAKMPNAERDEKVTEVMDLLGLTAGADGLVCKKSGGQLRRISIAMELVTDPELFVLDEPDSGLDGVIAREIFTKLRGIADEGKIVIVITHTPDRVIDLFDKVIVLAKDSGRVGRLAFYGSPQEARDFFGKDTMEGVVMSVNRKEEGGEGLADECIERYANMTAEKEEGVRA